MPPPGSLTESPGADQTVPHLELSTWRARFGLTAGITIRGPSGDFTLPHWNGQPAAPVRERWERFRRAVAPTPQFSTLAFSHQVHGDRVRVQETPGEPGEGVIWVEGFDGHVTAAPGVLLAVSVADCVPVYLTTRDGRAVGLLHAGWRGTAAGILERGVERFSGVAKVLSGDVIMHCGVAICGACYEVGSEVSVAVLGRPAPGGGRESLDLRAELARRAMALGVGEVTISPWCTAQDQERFHSHRASGGRAGRMIAFLGMAARDEDLGLS